MRSTEIYSLLHRLQKEGIVGEMGKTISFTDEPKFYSFSCETKGTPGLGNHGCATDLTRKNAEIRAISESVERYCLSNPSRESLTKGSYFSLSGGTIEPVDPASFVFRRELQEEEKLDEIRSLEINWIKGKCLNTGNNFLLPAQAVYADALEDEDLFYIPISTGAACDENPTTAINRGLIEIIERNDFMLSWLSNRSLPRINLESENLKSLSSYFARYKLEPYVFETGNTFGTHSVLAIILDRTGLGPAVSAGSKTHNSQSRATIGALLEAQQTRNWTRFLRETRHLPEVDLPGDIENFKTRAAFWYHPKKIDLLDKLTDALPSKNCQSGPSINHPVAELMLETGNTLYSVDITVPGVARAGLSVVKSIVPEMHPLTISEKFGYDSSPTLNKLGITNLNSLPHPML